MYISLPHFSLHLTSPPVPYPYPYCPVLSSQDWTIIRPGGLKSEPATGKAILTEDHLASGVVNRADVADLVVKALASTKCTRKELSCIDPSQASSFEAFQNAKPFDL
jgi:hypothetical protein